MGRSLQKLTEQDWPLGVNELVQFLRERFGRLCNRDTLLCRFLALPKSRIFQQEILAHMIALCPVRIAMLEVSCLSNVSVAQLGFARALTETRLFFKLLVFTADMDLWPSIRATFVQCFNRYRVHSKYRSRQTSVQLRTVTPAQAGVQASLSNSPLRGNDVRR